MRRCRCEFSILGYSWLYSSKQAPSDSLIQNNSCASYLHPNWPISINWNGYSHCSACALHAHHILIACATHAHFMCTACTLHMHGVHLIRQTNVHRMPTAHALHVLYIHTAHVTHAPCKCKALTYGLEGRTNRRRRRRSGCGIIEILKLWLLTSLYLFYSVGLDVTPGAACPHHSSLRDVAAKL